jgi:hypothetical protein
MTRTRMAGHLLRFAGLPVAAALTAMLGCGQGRAIFNVDVLSFIGGQGRDTLHYLVPGGTSGTLDNPPVEVTLLQGLGNSTVDSVTLTVAAAFENQAGSGKVKFQVFFSGSTTNLYSSTPYAQDSALVSGADTVLLAPGPIPLVADSIFGQSKVYVGVRALVAADPGPTMDGRLRMTKVLLRIVLQDKLF